MSKDPAILFYTSDFMTGTFTMTDSQVGKYIRLLCLQHQKGRLEKSDMMKICKTYDKDIFSKFIEDQDSMFFNERLENEMIRRKDYSESRRKNRMSKKKDKKKISKSYVKHMETETETINRTKEYYREEIKKSKDNKGYTNFVWFLFEKNDTGEPLICLLKLTEQIGWEHYRVLQRKIELMREKKGYAGTLKQKVLGYVNGGYKKSKFFGTMDSWITGDANREKIDLPDNDEIRKYLRK